MEGEIHETAYFQPLCPGCEVFFTPSSNGG